MNPAPKLSGTTIGGVYTRHREQWVLFAKKGSKYRILLKTFPLCGSRSEALDRVKIRMGTHPEWKAEYRGWTILPVRVDGGIVVE